MEYDKNSFLAGLAVGRRLGWNGGETPAGGGHSTGVISGAILVHGFTGKVLVNADIVFGELTEEA